MAVKARLLELIAEATGAGWSFRKACGMLGLGERRACYWQQRAAAGALADRKPGGTPVHALRPEEVDAILGLAEEWGEIDASHGKLAHRGSYLGRVWVSPSAVLRVLLEHGRRLPYRLPRQASVKRPWPEWVEYKPRPVWGDDFSEFPRAGTSALAILDLVSRKWIETMLCPEATDVQVRVLFTRALEREGLLDVILSLIDEHAAGEPEDELPPILLSVLDNGARMRSGSTREFMALHAIATYYGRPGTPTDQAHLESLFGHVKYEWSYLCALQNPADLSREFDAVREQYNSVRLHAGIGYVTQRRARGPRARDPSSPPRRPRARPRAAPGLQPRHPPEADRMTTTPPQRQEWATDHSACLAAGLHRAAQRAGSRRDRPNRTRQALSGPVLALTAPLGSSAADLTSPSAKPARTVKASPTGPSAGVPGTNVEIGGGSPVLEP